MILIGWAPDGRGTHPWPDGSGLVPGYRDTPPGLEGITLSLPADLLDELRERAARRGTSISEEARVLLERGRAAG